jgi:hypothetical protein
LTLGDMLTSSAIGIAHFGFLLQAGFAVIPLIQPLWVQYRDADCGF